MYGQLVLFFQNLFYDFPDVDFLMEANAYINTFNAASNSWSTSTMSVADYLACLCAFISLIFIIILCCLFVYKIIKLVGGLITR